MKTQVLRGMLFIVMLLAVLFGFSSAQAQTTNTWIQPDGGTHNWSDSANWQDNNVANGTDVTALFNVTPGGDQTATLDTAVILGGLSLEWSNRNLTISGTNALTLDVTTNTPILDVNSGRILNMNAELAGSDGLQLQGGGRLDINATPTLTGGLTVIGSTLGLNQSGVFNSAINAIANGPISLSEGGRLLLRGGNNSSSQVFVGTGGGLLQNRGNNHYVTTGILTGSGTLTYGNAGGSGGRSLQFNSTANDFTGGFVLTDGQQTIQVNSLGGGNNIRFNGSGTFRYHSGATAAVTLGAIELSGSGGTIENTSSHPITINTNLIATGAGNKTLELTGAAGPTNVFAGAIADETDGGEGTVALTKSGSSTWVLSGANTYSGVTTVSGGTLALRGDYSLPHEGTLNRTGGTIDIEGRAAVADLQASGVSLPVGIYGSTESGAQFNGEMLEIDAETEIANFFTGTGVLYVNTPFPAAGTLIIVQ